MYKSLTIILLSLMISVVNISIVTATDTTKSYTQEIQDVLTAKLITENPEQEANKCEVLQIMSRYFKWNLTTETNSPFTDVPEWCAQAAITAYEQDIVEGRTQTTLGLETPVTRYEVAVMLYRELLRRNFQFNSTIEKKFNDKIVDWAEVAVQKLSQEGIIKGHDNNTFLGNSSILKQDLAIMLLRLNISDLSTQNPENSDITDENIIGSWTFIEATQNQESVLKASDSKLPFIATFDQENRVSIKGDCNSIFGPYTLSENGKIKFDELTMTLMFCAESIETEFLQHLQASIEYSIENNSLTLLTLSEETAGTMKFTKNSQ